MCIGLGLEPALSNSQGKGAELASTCWVPSRVWLVLSMTHLLNSPNSLDSTVIPTLQMKNLTLHVLCKLWSLNVPEDGVLAKVTGSGILLPGLLQNSWCSLGVTPLLLASVDSCTFSVVMVSHTCITHRRMLTTQWSAQYKCTMS